MRALLIAAIACSATTVVAQPTTPTPTPTTPTTPAMTTTATMTPPAEEERPSIWSTPTPWVTILVGGAAAFGSVAVLTYVPLPTDNLGAFNLAAPFVVTSGAVVGTRLLLPEPTALNVTLPAVGASLGLAAGFVAAGIFGSRVVPEQTDAGSVASKNATLAGFAVGVAGGALLGTAIGVLVADVIE